MAEELPLEVINSLRLAHQALTEKGRKNAQDVSPLEAFYDHMWKISLPHKHLQKLQKPGIEAFYSGNMKKDDFVALLKKNVFIQGYVQDVNALTELCFNTFLSVGYREQEVEKYIPREAARQLWQVFAKLDKSGRLGLPNEEVNELLLRVATFSQLELASEMARVATMEVVDFWHFVEILIVQVFQKFNKQFSQKIVQDLHDDIVQELLKKGMMKKRGHVRKNWKDRYFVLTVRSLTYYESQTNHTKKGQLFINQYSTVMLVTEEGRKAESSSRFRVTCGSTRTATDIVAENCDVAMEWVKAIQVAIAFHQINEKQCRNFLHQLTLARRDVKGAMVDVHKEVLMSPGVGDPPFQFPAATSPDKNGASSLSSAQKSSVEPRLHEYEDVDAVADICTQLKPSRTPPATTARTLSPYKSAPLLPAESQYTVVQKKTSQPSRTEAVVDNEEAPPPPPPKRMGAKSSDDPMQYVDLKFLSSDDPVSAHDKQRMMKQQKRDHAVDYADVDAVAMALATAAVDEATRGSKERKVSPDQPQSRLAFQSKPMKDITHAKHTDRKASADGDYINISYGETSSAVSSRKMVDVTTVPKRQLSKDGDYVGVSYDSNGKSVTGRISDPILEVSSSAGEKQAADDYINLLSMAEETETVTSKFMMDVTEESVSKQSGNGDYVGITYDASCGAPAKGTINDRQRGAPPSIPIRYSGDCMEESYVTIKAPVDPPQPKPRKKSAPRPSSMIEGGSRPDALSVAPEGHRYSRGLTPSPDLDSKARKHDYVMLLPDTTVTESSGRKKPPPVPRPYHETHYYMNIPKPQSSPGKPALPPKT